MRTSIQKHQKSSPNFFKLLAFIFFSSVLLSHSIHAQPKTEAEPNPSHPSSPSLTSILWQDLLSPATTSARQTFYVGAPLTLLSWVYSRETSHRADHDFAARRPLGPASRLGDWAGQMWPNALYTSAMALSTLLPSTSLSSSSSSAEEHDRNWRRSGVMLRASLLSGGMAVLLKSLISETRPDGSTRNSFPSGHATTAFAFAGTVFFQHEWYYGVPALMLATWSGLSRVNDHRHFFHDVIAGASLGFAYAWGVYLLDRDRHIKNSEAGSAGPQSSLLGLPVRARQIHYAVWPNIDKDNFELYAQIEF